MSNFRENLRNELDYQDVKVKELCETTGIGKPTIESYLRTQSSDPTIENAVKIARALRVSVEYLVNGEDKGRTKRHDMSNEARELIRWVESLNSEQCRATLRLVKALRG